MQCTVGAHGVCVHSVSWIRHLGMACGEMFIVRCSHNLPATAELPFANRPGDRTDRFRSTCQSYLFVLSSPLFSNALLVETFLGQIRTHCVWG